MDLDSVEEESDVLPAKSRVRRSYTYVVAEIVSDDTCRLHEFDDSNGGRKSAMKFVNQIGHDRVMKVYKVVQVIQLKVETQVKVSF